VKILLIAVAILLTIWLVVAVLAFGALVLSWHTSARAAWRPALSWPLLLIVALRGGINVI
jgi:hypothetical protein